MKSLPSQNYTLLAYIFIHAQSVVEQQKFNKMSLSALGVLLQPMLNLSKNQVRIFLLNAVSSQAKEESNMPSRLLKMWISSSKSDKHL
uniref:Rho-GAP domain-containing protein n=1 Tax=Ditylenchus dipsaci TaxID=166011 RepID=A0A915DEL7_9BILA